MKPFNLERAIAGDKIVTRDGREVRFIAYVPELNAERQVVCVVDGSLITCTKTGALRYDASNDLFMASVKRTVWVNLYEAGGAQQYASQAVADGMDRGCKGKRLGGKAHKIEMEE